MENQHIVPKNKSKWGVKSEGKNRAAKIFETKEEAVVYAKNRARKEKSCAYMHSRDSVIKKVNCFN